MPVATDSLSLVFHALADPTRRGMLERLSRGDVTVGDLGAPFEMSAPAVSQHLRVLERANLVTRSTRAQWRVCTLSPDALEAASAWVAENRKTWEERFDHLDEVLTALEQEESAR